MTDVRFCRAPLRWYHTDSTDISIIRTFVCFGRFHSDYSYRCFSTSLAGPFSRPNEPFVSRSVVGTYERTYGVQYNIVSYQYRCGTRLLRTGPGTGRRVWERQKGRACRQDFEISPTTGQQTDRQTDRLSCREIILSVLRLDG
jgi:hypothetical protein